MALKVKHREAADVAEPVNVYRELTEKVDDGGNTRGKREPQNERRQHDGNKLLRKGSNFHRKQFTELLMYLWQDNDSSSID